jgi:PAS domain S-box-containing protein
MPPLTDLGLFTLLPLVALLSSTVVSAVSVRRIGEYRLLVLVGILMLMGNHQLLEASQFLQTGVAPGGTSEIVETGANLLTSVAVLYGISFAERQQEIAAELADSERRYRTLTEQSPLPILTLRDGTVAYANGAAASVFRAETPSEIEGVEVETLVYEEDREAFTEHCKQIAADGDDLHSAEHRFRATNGDVRTAVVAGGRSTYHGEPATYLLLRDVTREREYEAGLERVEAQYETTLASTNDAIFLLDPAAGEIAETNRRAAELLGYDRGELVGMDPHEIHPHETESFDEFLDTVLERGDLLTDELSCRTRSGATVPVDISASAVTVGDRECVLVSARDISERKRREHQIDVLRRLLRHNLRNEMTVVVGFADTIVQTATDDSIRRAAEQIKDRASELTSTSATVRRLQRVLRTRADGNAVDVTGAVEDVASQYREAYPDATVEADVPDGLEVDGADGIEFALEQLVENALEHDDSDEPLARISVEQTTDADGGDRLHVTVVDDGPGIPEQELAALDVNVEQTDVNHGSGVGLHVVGQVATHAGGSVSVSTAESTDGTAVELDLPVSTVN